MTSVMAVTSAPQPVARLVEALVVVLAEVEAARGEPQQMVETAQAKLVKPREHLDRRDWGTPWREAAPTASALRSSCSDGAGKRDIGTHGCW